MQAKRELLKICPELILQVGRFTLTATSTFHKSRTVAAHLFQKLHVTRLRFGRHIRTLKQFYYAHTFLFFVQSGKNEHMFRRQLSFAAVCERACFSGLQYIDKQFFIQPQSTRSFFQAGLFQINLSDQAQAIGFVQQPDRARAGTDRGYDTSQKLLEKHGRSEVLAGHLLNLASQLHDAFADFFQIFVGRNRLSHGSFRCTQGRRRPREGAFDRGS